jgi:hypothetical protein
MMFVFPAGHAARDPNRFTLASDTRPFLEVPARADALLAALTARGLTVQSAKDHGLDRSPACMTPAICPFWKLPLPAGVPCPVQPQFCEPQRTLCAIKQGGPKL